MVSNGVVGTQCAGRAEESAKTPPECVRTLPERWSLLAGVALLLAVLPFAVAETARPHWVCTWASPMTADHSGGKVMEKVTLRQIVRTSVGGSAVRITFSNRFGREPLVLGHVRVAQHGEGAAILPPTQRDVSFRGEDSVTIPAGETITSDAVPMHVAALTQLAVSAYLPGPVHASTLQNNAHRTGYLAQGDSTGTEKLTAAAGLTRSLYFLSAVDVDDAQSPGVVVTLGASITEGSIITDDSDHAWPSVLATRLSAAGSHVGVVNMGISGNRLLMDGAGESAEKRFDRDVLQVAGVRAVIFSDDPINDLGSTHPVPTAEDLIAGTKRLMARAHARGILFYCSTLTPFEGANYWTPEEEVQREKINALLRQENSGCDGMVDQDAATHDPDRPTRYLADFDHGDHLHPNDRGHEAVGHAIDLRLFDPQILSRKPSRRRHGKPVR